MEFVMKRFILIISFFLLSKSCAAAVSFDKQIFFFCDVRTGNFYVPNIYSDDLITVSSKSSCFRQLQSISIAHSCGDAILYLCRSKEAQDHFDNAKDALVDAIEHSMNAGLGIVVPPIAIIEGYKAVESWLEWAHEYNEGVRCEERESQESLDE